MPKHTRTFRSKKLHPEHVKLLNEAIRRNAKGGDHNLHISYTKADGSKSDRKVKPLAVKGKSLFVAHCHKRNAIRSFKVERIDMIKQAFWVGFEKRSSSLKNILRETKALPGALLFKLQHGGVKHVLKELSGVPGSISAAVKKGLKKK